MRNASILLVFAAAACSESTDPVDPAPTRDAGATERDAGVESRDGGQIVRDAGTSAVDAGTRDGGVRDAGGDPWEAVGPIVDAHEIPNLALIVGDETGVLFVHEKGNTTVDTNYAIASATKWMTAAIIASLIDDGLLALDDRPQDYLTYWTNDANDERSTVTLEQLLAFTSGISGAQGDIPCLTDQMTTLQACAQDIYDNHFAHTPGATFDYSGGHMHVAAAMAEVASGKTWVELLDEHLKMPLQLTARTRFRAAVAANPGVAGAMLSTGAEYAEFLHAFFVGDYLPNWTNELSRIRTRDLPIAYTPVDVVQPGASWGYALGNWVECGQPTFDASCEQRRVYSSPGAFGFYPWIDRTNGYWAVLSVQLLGGGPTARAYDLVSQVRPAIENALP